MSEVPLHWAVTSTAAEVYKRDLEAAKRLADATTRLSKSIDDGSAASKKQAAAVLNAAESIRKERQIAEATVKVAREWGVSHRTASQIARKFKGDVDALSADLRREAVALDRAQRETQELARAQRAASATGRSHLVTVRNLHQAYALLAGAAGIRAATSAVLDWIEKAERQERSLAQIDARLKSTGNTIGLTTAQIAAMANEIQRSTGIGDEALIEQAGVILSFTEITQDNFRGTLEAALDMAAALGKDIPSQVLALSKALAMGREGLTQLQRSGTVFQGNLKEQILALYDAGQANEAQALILKEVNRQYGGAAEAARAYGGTTAALKTEIDDLKESLGKLILDQGGLRAYLELVVAITRETTGLNVKINEETKAGGALADSVASVLWQYAALLELRKRFGLQSVEFKTWNDKNREAMEAALAVTRRYAKEDEQATISKEQFGKASERLSRILKEEEEARKKIADRGTAYTDAMRTAQERLDEQMREGEELYRAGAITLDTLTEARRRYNEESQKLRTEDFVELRDRIAEAKAKLDELASYEEIDIQVRLDLESLNASLSEAISTALSGDELLQIPGLEAGMFADVPALIDSYDAVRKSTAEQLRQLDVLTGSFDLIAFAFQDIDSSLGQLITRLAKVAGNISSSIGDIQAGGAQGGAMGALGVVGGVIGIFSQVYSLAQGMLADARAKRFGVPLTAQVSGGRFSAQAIGSGAVSQEQAVQTVEAWRAAINDFRQAIGGFLVDLPEIATRVRNDGKEVELSVGGVVYGIFDSLEEAFEAGLRIAVGQANIEGIGPAVAAALARTSASTMDELLRLLPVLKELDDVAAGLTSSYSRAKTAEESFRTGLDIEAEKLLSHGAALADVVAWRQREIEAQQELLRASGNALAGVSTSFGRLQEWMDSVKAFNEAQGQEAARLVQLTQYAERAAGGEQPPGLGGAGGTGGGGGLGGGGGDGGGGREGPAGRARSLTVALDGQSKATADATARSRELTESYVEQIRASVRIQAQASLFSELADFEEAYGVKLSGGLDMRQQIAELEFRAAQIRIALLVEELAANAQLLGITDAQIAQYRQWAQEVGAADFTGIRVSGGGGGPSRKQKQEELERATEAWNAELERLAALQTGATEDELSRAAALAELAAKGRDAKMAPEVIANALSMLAELQLRDLAGPWAESAATLGRIDLKNAFIELRDRAKADFAAALVSAVDNPQAYRAARDAIEAGLTAELHKLGQDALTSLGSPLRALRLQFQETARSIRYMMRHLEELDLTAEQVAGQVRQAVLPSLLDLIEAQARRTGNEAALKIVQERRAQLEMTIARVQFEQAVALLRLVDGITPGIQSLIDLGRDLFELATTIDPGDGGGTLPWRRNNAGDDPPPPGSTGLTEGETLASIIARLQRDAMTPMERLAADFEEMMARIATSSGTAEERALAAALAQEAYARALAEMENLESIADIIADLERDAMTPMERLAADFEAMMARIAASSGTAEEKALAAALAQEAYARALAELEEAGGGGAAGATADILKRLRRNAASDLERLEMDFADLFQEIADSSGTAAEKAEALALAEEELARLRQELTDRQLTDLYSLAAKLEQEILSRAAPKAQIESAQAAFQAAAANLDINDEDSVKAFREAADAYLNSAASYSDLVGSDQILKTAQEAVLAILTHYGITGSGPAVNPPPLVLGPPPGAVAPLAGFGGAVPLAPPAPIIIASPTGGNLDVSALATEVATLRREVQIFHADVKANAGLWTPTRRAIETGAIAANR